MHSSQTTVSASTVTQLNGWIFLYLPFILILKYFISANILWFCYDPFVSFIPREEQLSFVGLELTAGVISELTGERKPTGLLNET